MSRDDASPVLRLEALSKHFGGARALDGVDLTVLPGEVHGLLGQNGSGKSTLIKVLAGFHDPDPGAKLWIAGAPVPLPIEPGAAGKPSAPACCSAASPSTSTRPRPSSA